MKRDIIDSLMAGGLLSFYPIWQINSIAEQIVIAIGLAILIYITILFFRKEESHEHNNNQDPPRH